MKPIIRNILDKFNLLFYNQDDIAQEMMDKNDAIKLLIAHGYEVKFQKLSLADFGGNQTLLDAAELLAHRHGLIIQHANGEQVGKSVFLYHDK
ncbi:hypothetical protein DDO73_17360 [Vibrio cholerae]|uniref:hypothetical protein n=1 Tax=Vibrio cholerae TaxID=666 RepID=UPI00067FE244|nr:hypothetical protein [Vibrio cholerae]EGR4074827.1 hypothetical protein [Vibrio cholerae]HAS5670768.1 hypothetical protein [Vibrio cholerae]HAS5778718.1 hypothetical protein [Vibrio cholerae]HAU9839193.1 hypothetical protein [Vibrio cholerae O1]